MDTVFSNRAERLGVHAQDVVAIARNRGVEPEKILAVIEAGGSDRDTAIRELRKLRLSLADIGLLGVDHHRTGIARPGWPLSEERFKALEQSASQLAFLTPDWWNSRGQVSRIQVGSYLSDLGFSRSQVDELAGRLDLDKVAIVLRARFYLLTPPTWTDWYRGKLEAGLTQKQVWQQIAEAAPQLHIHQCTFSNFVRKRLGIYGRKQRTDAVNARADSTATEPA
jgi:hypothetical protein